MSTRSWVKFIRQSREGFLKKIECHVVLGQIIARPLWEGFEGKKLGLYCVLVFYSPLGGVPSAVEFLIPSECQARRRGIHKWVRIGLSRDGLGRGIFNPSVKYPDQPHQGKVDCKGQGGNSLGPHGVLVWWCRPAGEDTPIPLLPLGSGR